MWRAWGIRWWRFQPLGNLLYQLPRTLVGGGGNLHQGIAQGLHMGPEGLQQRRVLQDVRLVGGHNLGPLRKIRAVALQLFADGIEVGHRVTALAAGHVHHMDQQAAAEMVKRG